MRRGMPASAAELSYLEKKVLLTLEKRKKATPEELRTAGKFRELVEVMNAASWLQAKSLVTVKERESVRREIALTAAAEKILAGGLELKEEVAQPTTDLLRFGKWRNVDFRRYDPKAFAPLVRPGKRHVLGAYIEKIRRIFLSMGFTEIDGNFVQAAFWNFDALFQPQDHPARDQLDTFYLAKPSTVPLPEERIVDRVAKTHEDGGGTGSAGSRYRWDRKEAERGVLRSHTTPITLQWLAEHPDPPRKAFIIGRNFRPYAIRWKHLPDF